MRPRRLALATDDRGRLSDQRVVRASPYFAVEAYNLLSRRRRPVSTPLHSTFCEAAYETFASLVHRYNTTLRGALLQQLETETARLRERFELDRIGVLLGTSTAGADVTEAAYRQ